MSEDEEKCRLTYREGKRIAELAEKPFVKAKRWLFYTMIVMLLLFLGMSAYEKYNPPETPEEALEAGFYAILGERAARKALAEANEEKDERWTRE